MSTYNVERYIERENTEIVSIGDYEIHPYANIVPLLEVDTLIPSVAKRGLDLAIVRVDGKIIDGRRRMLACLYTDTKPRFDDRESMDDRDIYELVLALNNRRNVSKGQLAAIAAFETGGKRHRIAGYTDAITYAKEVWGVGSGSYKNAAWLFIYHKNYLRQIKETGYAHIGDRGYSLTAIVKFLKEVDKSKKSIGGDKEIAIAIQKAKTQIIPQITTDIEAIEVAKLLNKQLNQSVVDSTWLHEIQDTNDRYRKKLQELSVAIEKCQNRGNPEYSTNIFTGEDV